MVNIGFGTADHHVVQESSLAGAQNAYLPERPCVKTHTGDAVLEPMFLLALRGRKRDDSTLLEDTSWILGWRASFRKDARATSGDKLIKGPYFVVVAGICVKRTRLYYKDFQGAWHNISAYLKLQADFQALHANSTA